MQITNLSFRHHKEAPYFFQNLSFALEEGRIHALHGKNGVGKSVLLSILSREIGPEATLMSQQFDQTLVGEFSFLENLEFASLPRFPSPFSRLRAAAIPEHFLELLERFHIDRAIPVQKLSGGQRQILALLIKLQRNPRILLLDEPTAALDEQNAILVFEFLKALKGVTMLVVCHDRELIDRYATGQHLQMEIGSSGVRELKEFVQHLF